MNAGAVVARRDGPIDALASDATDVGFSATTLALAAVAVVLTISLAVWLRRSRRRSAAAERDHERATLAVDAESALSASLPPGVGTHLERPIEVIDVAVLESETLQYVPIVRVPLGTTDRPGPALVFEYVAAVLETIQPIFADEPVHHYDVQFTFGPDGLLVSGECRRVGVPSALATRFVEEPTYRTRDLRRDVETADRDDDAPVVWGCCRSYA